MDDPKLIEILRSKKQHKALKRLYRYYPKIEKLILSKGGSKQDAQDIFQEALIIFCNKIEKNVLEITSSIDTYLFSVCRFLWKNELKKRKKGTEIDFSADLSLEMESDLEEIVVKEERIKVAESILNELGARCLELLKAFYYEGLSMRDIAFKMGFRSDKIAKNQKYKCVERAKLKLKAHPSTL